MTATTPSAAGGGGHTPGPWSLGRHEEGARWVNGGGWHKLATVYVEVAGGPNEEGIANAHLIAAAPDLLEACKRLLACIELINFEGDPTAELARAAILKATGASQ